MTYLSYTKGSELLCGHPSFLRIVGIPQEWLLVPGQIILMSYDIILFKPREDEDPLTTARRDNDLGELPVTPPDPSKEALKQKVASSLMPANASLEPFKFNYEEIAKIERISAERAKLKYRHIELNGPDDSNAIQIQLYDDQAFVTVPYWHDGAKAEAVFKEIWEYLNIIQRETGYVAYDPQRDAILDLSQGYTQALSLYTGTQAVMTDLPNIVQASAKKRRWWQFWKK